MDFFLRFAHPLILLYTLPLVALVCFVYYKYARTIVYRYSLASAIGHDGFATTHPYKKISWFLRFISLVILAFLLAKPQLVDLNSHILVEGIDIVLTLDISGSMRFRDYEDDRRSRIAVAKDEAKLFVDKRDNDAIGLVIFGNDAVSRCPITSDKTIIKSMIDELDIGLIDPDGTLLSTGLITALNRFKKSKAKSKIIILLTDGEPSPGDDKPEDAIEIAKQLGVKVYTIGIGSEQAEYIHDPFYGVQIKPGINKTLLSKIAQQTGGKFFNARNAQDMRVVYNTIDMLEKTEYETNMYNKYYDIFVPFVWFILLMVALEIILASFIWFGL